MKVTRTSDSLIAAIVADQMPSAGACVDFGITGPKAREVYGALQWGFRHDVLTEDEIHEASCSGPKVTKLVARAVTLGSPYGAGLVVTTAWDDMPEDPEE